MAAGAPEDEPDRNGDAETNADADREVEAEGHEVPDRGGAADADTDDGGADAQDEDETEAADPELVSFRERLRQARAERNSASHELGTEPLLPEDERTGDPAADREKLVVSPRQFARYAFDFEYPDPEHLRELIYEPVAEAVAGVEGAPRHLCRLMPREHGKSVAASVVCPTWLALKDRNARILVMSKTLDQAKGKVRQVREHIQRLTNHPEFANERIVESTKTELTLAREQAHDVPTVKAVGFNSGITGGHFDFIVFDDIVDWENQRTPSRREKIWTQFQDYQNLGAKAETVFLVVGTRKHREDLYSQLINGPAWDSDVQPAFRDWSIVENNEYTAVTDRGTRYPAAELDHLDPREETIVEIEPHRQMPVLWPERWPLSDLLFDLHTGYGSEQGSLVWRRENLNDATVFEGEVLSADMLTFASKIGERREACTWFAGLDPAVESDPEKAARNDTDYWALAIGGYSSEDETTYVDTVERKRGMSLSRGLTWVENHLARYPRIDFTEVLAEGQQAQEWLGEQGTKRDLPMRTTKNTDGKEERIHNLAARFEDGEVMLLDSEESRMDSWESFVNEWCAFPNGAHDDRLDAVDILVRSAKNKTGYWGGDEGGYSIFTIEDDDVSHSNEPTYSYSGGRHGSGSSSDWF